MLSTYIALVLLSIAAAKSAGSVVVTHLTEMLNFLRNTRWVCKERFIAAKEDINTFELIVGLYSCDVSV
jgi:hypothetical protein